MWYFRFNKVARDSAFQFDTFSSRLSLKSTSFSKVVKNTAVNTAVSTTKYVQLLLHANIYVLSINMWILARLLPGKNGKKKVFSYPVK